MNGQQNTIQPRKKFLLNDWRQPFPATDVPLEGGKYPGQLMFEQKNNGQIVMKVSDGVYKEGAGKLKEIEMDWAHRNVMFEALLEAASNENFDTKQISVRWKQFVRTGGMSRMSEQPIQQGYLTISRDKNGVIFLGYSKGADYKAQFRFKGPKDTVVISRNEQGEKAEDHGLMSRWMVRAWVNFHRPILDRMELEGWQPPKSANNGNGGFNGGGNNNGNGGFNGGGNNNGNGGSSAPSGNNFDDYDTDIDF